ncbi:MAG: DUF255 domain-containing protein [Streptosporangiales bacterium]|nr:DUF255 domain-containing protein [Streptosporangiales bacterium]
MGNRLADSTSPYLQQHASNPVAWQPWHPEAFAEARERDVPVLLSIGYSSCHWCHVMAHESFEDGPTAALINEGFVAIKVDREERPDVDAVYMEATQALTGQGGWPMTAFLTPDGEPFYCGTYYPRDHFQQLLRAVRHAWREQRTDLVQQGQKIVAALSQQTARYEGAQAPGPDAMETALNGLTKEYDARQGGFGGAPKFPPSMVIEFLLRHHARTADARALRMARDTASAMAAGGMYDQLAGGFARYSVDAGWVVPHFEKMLYDNALLARVYAHLYRTTGAEWAGRVALETADWMVADLRTAQGGFASALDADSEGEEGRYYVWTPAELREVLGDEEGAWAAGVFGVTERGTFEHGASVLQLRERPADLDRYALARRELLRARASRVPPARDDKVVAAWNGLAIAALAEIAAIFGRPDLLDVAEAAGELLATAHMSEGRLLRTSRDGTPGANAGVLEDYADVAEGLIALYGVTGRARWIELAGDLLEIVLTRFGDDSGGFYDTADDAERLFRRPQDPTDNATPGGWFAAAGALLSYAALTGSARHRTAAEAALAPLGVLAGRFPRFCGWGLAVAEARLAGPTEIAVVGPPDDPRTAALHRTALHSTAPGAVVALGTPGAPPAVPLLEHRDMVGGAPAAYVCRGFTCRLPVTDPDALLTELSAQT